MSNRVQVVMVAVIHKNNLEKEEEQKDGDEVCPSNWMIFRLKVVN